MTETEEQKRCPYCHRDIGVMLIPYVGFYRDPDAKGDGYVDADECKYCHRSLKEAPHG